MQYAITPLLMEATAELHPEELQGILDPFSRECEIENGVELWLNENVEV